MLANSAFNRGDLVTYGKNPAYLEAEGIEGIVIRSDTGATHLTVTKGNGRREHLVGSEAHLSNEFLTLLEPAESEPKEDAVNSPSHYTRFPVEVIELTRHLNFCRGNAVKYIARAGHKDPAKELEDLKKARWYVDDEIKELEKKLAANS